MEVDRPVLARGLRSLLERRHVAGKSTLLQILAGKKMTPSGATVAILGRDVFRNTPPVGLIRDSRTSNDENVLDR